MRGSCSPPRWASTSARSSPATTGRRRQKRSRASTRWSSAERTAAIECPLVGFFGQDDTNPSPGDVDRIDAELTAKGKPHEFHRYEGAGHAFLNFTNAERHRPAQAADAWGKLLAFLDARLGLAARGA